ncbi:MAG: alpha-amylase family glycosyl hydrolase [Candidatus Saccharibacteria bacterium]|nr:alpha-amylase family glycosyl hydrolase [Candidatus Saccharibacteria bacterium]
MAKTLVYQLYPSSWGHIAEMTRHLHRICKLGVDYVWLGPIYPSPWHDHGYDVKNYRGIRSNFGTMKDFDHFVATAHQLGIKVLMDLVLNHTSTKHEWFTTKPEYYCWSDVDHPGWRNLFSNGPAWRYNEERELYYLHLFHDEQADLNWFPDGRINQELVSEFKQIVSFWVNRHGVDGFRLDFPQAINKDFSWEILKFDNLLQGHRGAEVIDAIFSEEKSPFLIMECFDPTFGEIVEYYADHTPVDFVLNVMVKESVDNGWSAFAQCLGQSTKTPAFMLDLESHDSPRFPSRAHTSPERAIETMFGSSAEGICLYQGQELGLKNPSERELSDSDLMKLDAQTAMRFILGESLEELRPLSRANARVPFPFDVYEAQTSDPVNSYFFFTQACIENWKNNT